MKKLSAVLFFCLLLVAAGCDYFDPYHPDTKGNRKAFKITTGFAPEPAIKNIYADNDYFGLDSRYSLLFTAPPEAVKRIVEKLDLKKTEESQAFFGPDYPPWMSKEELEKADHYQLVLEKTETSYNLWYDPKTEKCQIMTIYW